MMKNRFISASFVVFLLAGALVAAPQTGQSAPAHPRQNQQQPNAGSNPLNQTVPAPPGKTEQVIPGNNNPNSPSQELARTSETAAEGDETVGFKHSPVVRWISSKIGISVEAGYWILYSLDFAIIAVLIGWAWKKNIPAAFRTRTAAIRKTMDEAQAASADANRRLGEIEARLARIDTEIAHMAAAAESEAAAEEARIRAAAEQESRRIVEGAQAEIETSARLARRELKAYAADLAVALAEKRIHVDPGTDHQLVQNFSRELGNGNGNGGH